MKARDFEDSQLFSEAFSAEVRAMGEMRRADRALQVSDGYDSHPPLTRPPSSFSSLPLSVVSPKPRNSSPPNKQKANSRLLCAPAAPGTRRRSSLRRPRPSEEEVEVEEKTTATTKPPSSHRRSSRRASRRTPAPCSTAGSGSLRRSSKGLSQSGLPKRRGASLLPLLLPLLPRPTLRPCTGRPPPPSPSPCHSRC